MGELEVESMAMALGAIITVSLALTQALGGLLMYLVEAIKATGKVREGWAGIVALIMGMVLGGALGGLTDAVADESMSVGTLMGLGAFGGALMAAGAIKTYKAVGEVNQGATITLTPTVDDTELETAYGPETAINAETAWQTEQALYDMPEATPQRE
jgi:hypothetical protein